MSYYQAFNFAIRDFKENYEGYHRFFLKN